MHDVLFSNFHVWKQIIWTLLYIFRESGNSHNRLDEAYGLLCLSISPYLLFHIYCLTTPNQVCTKLDSLFGVQDELRAHQLEIELFSLSPSNFESRGFLHRVQVACSNAQALWDWEEGLLINHFHYIKVGSWIVSFCVYFSCYWDWCF